MPGSSHRVLSCVAEIRIWKKGWLLANRGWQLLFIQRRSRDLFCVRWNVIETQVAIGFKERAWV